MGADEQWGTAREVVADGVHLAVSSAGEGERPLLLVHGFTGVRGDFAPMVPALVASGFHVASFDHRGHGASDRPDDEAAYSIGHMADDALAVLDALGWSSFTLLGHSMGGVVAQELVARVPERIERLVLMATTPVAFELDRDAVAAGVRIVREQGLPKLIEILDKLGGRTPPPPAFLAACERIPGYRERGGRLMRSVSPAMYAAMATAFVDLPDRRRDLATVGCPTLVIVGEQDELMLAGSRALAEAIPGAEYVEVPDAAHAPQFENPDVFLSALLEFLSGVRTWWTARCASRADVVGVVEALVGDFDARADEWENHAPAGYRESTLAWLADSRSVQARLFNPPLADEVWPRVGRLVEQLLARDAVAVPDQLRAVVADLPDGLAAEDYQLLGEALRAGSIYE